VDEPGRCPAVHLELVADLGGGHLFGYKGEDALGLLDGVDGGADDVAAEAGKLLCDLGRILVAGCLERQAAAAR